MKDSIVEEVRKDLLDRSELGIKKYNTTLDRTDLSSSDWVQHAYEECLDMALYLKRLRREISSADNLLTERKIELLNQVIKNQEQEIDELNKRINIYKKIRFKHQ
jgi:hypothetical protein